MRYLRFQSQQITAMVRHTKNHLPHEACGVLIGTDDTVEQVIPMQNVSPSPTTEYAFDPQQWLKVLKQIDANQHELIAVFHSHPTSDPIPSSTDIQQARRNLPNVVYVILSLQMPQTRMQAWHIGEQTIERVEMVVGNQDAPQTQMMTKAQQRAILMSIIIGMLLLITISVILLPAAPPLDTITTQ